MKGKRMRRSTLSLLVATAALPLGGCAASLAAGAVGAAVRAADKPEAPGADPGPPALEACKARAAGLGQPHIIDLQYKSASKVTVWGTVQGSGAKKSFECNWDGRIVGFKLRDI